MDTVNREIYSNITVELLNLLLFYNRKSRKLIPVFERVSE